MDPQKLMRSIEDLSLIEYAKIIINAMKERKASSPFFALQRLDYPERDEKEDNSYLTLKQEDGEIKFDRIPIRFWGNMKEQYEAHNQDYTGVYKPEK
jgi:succinate dehydrogenase/fumarate reductase flavoprotein subunit